MDSTTSVVAVACMQQTKFCLFCHRWPTAVYIARYLLPHIISVTFMYSTQTSGSYPIGDL